LLYNSRSSSLPGAWVYRKELKNRLGSVFQKLKRKLKVEELGKVYRLLDAWLELSVFEPLLLEGWEALFEMEKTNFYAFNLDIKDF